MDQPFSLFDSPCAPDLLLDSPMPETRLLTCGGVTFQGHYEQQEFVVERLLSTNPADYLRHAPGQRIPLSCLQTSD